MSLILDALTKADAERHAGKLPETPSKNFFEPAAANLGQPFGKPMGWWIKTTILVLLAPFVAGWLVWQMQAGRFVSTNSGPAIVSLTPVVPSVEPSPAPVTQEAQAERSVAPAVAPPVTVAASRLPVPPPVPQAESAVQQSALKQSPVKPQPGKPQPRGAAEQSSQPPDEGQAVTLAQLPQSLRSEIPALAISGSIYSTDPKERLLLVDKRMLREGDEIAPGLVLDSVMQKGALLRYKGYLFKVNN